MIEVPKTAYPLAWPVGRPRARSRERSQFKVTLGMALQGVRHEVALLGGSELLISSNLELSRAGEPLARSRIPADTGVAVYFTLKKKPMCFACDRWRGVEENMRAIERTIEALRGLERWGSGSMLEQAFQGFTALPAPEQPFQVLGVSHDADRAAIEAAYRRLAAVNHPDRGGDSAQMSRINRARDAMLENSGFSG